MADDPHHPEHDIVPIGGRPLEYRPAGADRSGVRLGQMIGGAAVAILIGIAAVIAGILMALDRNMQTKSSDALLFVVLGVAAIAINGWAFMAYRSARFRGFGIGLWIGFGLTVLMDGVCFGLGNL